MPEVDRHWRMHWLFGVALSVGSVVYTVYALARAGILDPRGPHLLLDQLDLNGLWIAFGLGLFGETLVRDSARAHERDRRRRRALSGDRAGLARVRPESVTGGVDLRSDLQHDIRVLWQTTSYLHPLLRALSALTALLTAGVVALIASSLTSGDQPLLAIAGPFVIVLGVWVAWRRRARRAATRRAAFGVVATREGLVMRRRSRAEELMPWTDARLLEVDQRPVGRAVATTYTVHGASGRTVTWVDYPPDLRTVQPAGMSREEMDGHLTALLARIEERTRLTPVRSTPSLRTRMASSRSSPAVARSGTTSRTPWRSPRCWSQSAGQPTPCRSPAYPGSTPTRSSRSPRRAARIWSTSA